MVNAADIASSGVSTNALLEVRGLTAGYDQVMALHGVDLRIEAGQVVCVLGANGAGKTTLLRALSGLLPWRSGDATYQGRSMAGLEAEQWVRAGVVHVPQGRMIFGQLTVRENLMLGGYTRPARTVEADTERVLTYFPRLKERLRQRAGTLSGGEQQMLAIGRGLLAQPRVLMLDEPSMGVAPILKDSIFDTLVEIRNREQLTLLVVEQDADIALGISDVGYVLETGRVVLSGSAQSLSGNDEVRRAYLGGR